VFFLAVTYDALDHLQYVPTDFIGEDLEPKNIASTSKGELYCGDACEATRKKYVGLRGK
jgi:hypothetical protein